MLLRETVEIEGRGAFVQVLSRDAATRRRECAGHLEVKPLSRS